MLGVLLTRAGIGCAAPVVIYMETITQRPHHHAKKGANRVQT